MFPKSARVLEQHPRRRRTVASVAFCAAGAVVMGACGPAHLNEYVPKTRALPKQQDVDSDARPTTSGSLWRDGQLAGGLFVDARAFRINDVVIVKVEEVADAERSADTDVERRGSTSIGLNAVPLVGPILPAPPSVSANGQATTDSTFRGGGSTNRRERLVATVSTVVKQVLNNGNLFVEGHRAILVNQEEHHLYVSGIIRPIDVDQDNTIASSKIAEAEIEFVGRGVVSDNDNQGIIPRFLHLIWPF